MLLFFQLRDQIINLLSHRMPLNEFEDWLVQKSWNLHRSADALTQELAYATQLRLAEYDEDHLSEADLRRELRELADAYLPLENVRVSSLSKTVAYRSSAAAPEAYS